MSTLSAELMEELEGLAEIPNSRKIFLALKKLEDSDKKGVVNTKLYAYADMSNGTGYKHAERLKEAGVFDYDKASYILGESKIVEVFARLVSKYEK